MVRTIIQLPKEIHKQLREIAHKNHTSISATCREAIIKYLKEEINMYDDLQDLTGQESGIVIYAGKEGILCNWSNVDGLPRMFATGLVGLAEKIPVVDGEHVDDLGGILGGVNLSVCAEWDGEMPTSGTVYHVSDDVVVVAPDGWA
jgi:predicted transcriptional regulator